MPAQLRASRCHGNACPLGLPRLSLEWKDFNRPVMSVAVGAMEMAPLRQIKEKSVLKYTCEVWPPPRSPHILEIPRVPGDDLHPKLTASTWIISGGRIFLPMTPFRGLHDTELCREGSERADAPRLTFDVPSLRPPLTDLIARLRRQWQREKPVSSCSSEIKHLSEKLEAVVANKHALISTFSEMIHVFLYCCGCGEHFSTRQ